MKIKKVEIEAFRVYKTKADGTFDFTNDDEVPSNFVAIYAPNGFGKSSFYDAVEWAITNHLERLGGEYNKSNFESAARSTKNPNEGQKILRNKYADKQLVTKVKVSTTRPALFERELPQLRKNQRDARIGDNSRRENEFFRRVILSQDEIDRFLREANPHDRYIKFIESFGDDFESARKELSVLINDNEAELRNLDKRRNFLLKEMAQPIDLSVFEHFNSVATELNAVGENIILPDESFSSQSGDRLNASLVLRQHELNTLYQSNTKISEELVDRLAKLPTIELHFSNLEEQKIQHNRLLKGVTDADTYQTLFNSYEKCVADQKNTHFNLNQIIEIYENIEKFLQTKTYLFDSSLKQKELTENQSKSSIQLANLEEKLNELNTPLKTVDDRILFLRNSIGNAGSVYTELSMHQARIGVLLKQISDKNISIQIDKALYEKLYRELSEISALKITSNLLLAGDVRGLLFDQEKVEQLTKCHADLSLIEVHSQAIHATQKALTEQMELHEQLISIGLDYLSIQPSNICPLCTFPHSSVDTLVEKLKSQNLLSELSQENSRKLSFASIRQKELRTSIETITEQAIEAQGQQLSSLHKKLTEVSERLAQTELDKSTEEAEYKTLENRSVELENSVWALSYEELVSRVEGELKELTIKRSNLIDQQVSFSTQITLLTDLVKAKGSELQTLVAEVEIKCSEHAYVTVQAYLNEKTISVSDIKQHCEMRKNELDSELLKYKVVEESLIGQCTDLKNRMMVDCTWIDFSLLKLQKEAIEENLARSQSAINAFYEGLSNIIIHPEDTLENIKARIIVGIEDYRIRTQDIEKRLNGIQLLLKLISSFAPYIKRMSIKEELLTIRQCQEQRNKVHEVLKADMDVIVNNLKVLINNFFYEDLINSIYRKIDPHPAFKKVGFQVDFDSSDKPGLNIVVSDETGLIISPILYFSAAQTNILSLSVFLASALHAKDDEGNPIDVILIDDPIQSMDSINILSTIDLLRSICLQFDKQIIISTHDENFFSLLQRKIPAQILGSKFLRLEKFGVAVPVEPFLN